jgi:hypothetical protein
MPERERKHWERHGAAQRRMDGVLRRASKNFQGEDASLRGQNSVLI